MQSVPRFKGSPVQKPCSSVVAPRHLDGLIRYKSRKEASFSRSLRDAPQLVSQQIRIQSHDSRAGLPVGMSFPSDHVQEDRDIDGMRRRIVYCFVRFADKVVHRFRKPPVTPGPAQPLVHALLDHAPHAARREEKAVMVDLKAILDGRRISLRAPPRSEDEAVCRPNRMAIGRRCDLLRGFPAGSTLSTGDENTQIIPENAMRSLSAPQVTVVKPELCQSNRSTQPKS